MNDGLNTLRKTLAEEYSELNELQIEFQKVDSEGIVSKVKFENGKWIIQYNSIAGAARGLGSVISKQSGTEQTSFKTLGIMFDVSRNGVMTVEHFKKWLRKLALMGYNKAMLYTEEVYKLPDEPYFGYLRGAYSIDEIKEIDDYAAKLGIEMIACIQTLGHLGQLLKWNIPYQDISDTGDVMLVDEDDTYKLIAKMLDFWKSALRSKRIHIGMDETHGLGNGAFMRKYGYEDRFDIFNRHLSKVQKLCKERDLEPIIWSDMYFRFGSKTNDYYDKEAIIPETVKAKIPDDVQLVYWDYYHMDKEFYLDFIERHRQLGKEPLVAPCVRGARTLWYDHKTTSETMIPCLDACREAGVKEVLVTMWNDDGCYCHVNSQLAGLCATADFAYGAANMDSSMTVQRFTAICDADFAAHKAAAPLEPHLENEKGDEIRIMAALLLWDDPLLGIAYGGYSAQIPDFSMKIETHYAGIIQQLEAYSDNDISHALLLAEVLYKKLCIRRKMLTAYRSEDCDTLLTLVEVDIPELIVLYQQLSESFRKMWLDAYKSFGLETIQIRQAGQVVRLEETARCLKGYSQGDLKVIPELNEQTEHGLAHTPNYYRQIASSGIF